MGTTSSSLVVNLLDNESTTTTALEFAALMFRGFSLLMGVLLFENLVPSHIGGYYLIMACMAVIYLLLFALLTIRLPHSMAHKNDVGIVCRWALMIKIMVAIFTPFAYIINKLVNNRTANSNSNALSGDEISDMIEIAEGGDDVETETKMLKGIVRFSDLVVSEIMKSRVDVVAIEKNTSVSNIVDIAKETGFSRIPVYENTIDNIKGILYIKDLLPLMNSDTTEWNNLIRPAFFIPETKSVSDLLHEFQEDKIHVAIVVDEYGGTSGLVTLEDIIEEIVGEITDEYDKAETTYNQISDNTFLFNAKTSIIDFCKIMGLSDETFDDMRGDSETLAGLILEVVGEIPAEKENVSISNFDFLIVKADNRRIEQVQVTLKQE
jgi:gliding motility-associated protein GldE